MPAMSTCAHIVLGILSKMVHNVASSTITVNAAKNIYLYDKHGFIPVENGRTCMDRKEVLADTRDYVSINKTAERIGIFREHVFRTRHMFLAFMEDSKVLNLTEQSNMEKHDKTFVLESFKGTKIPDGYWRDPRKHWGKST